jgi:hypothetical protein
VYGVIYLSLDGYEGPAAQVRLVPNFLLLQILSRCIYINILYLLLFITLELFCKEYILLSHLP